MTMASGTRKSKWNAVLRGAAGRCPNCGHGKLLHRYLKVAERCTSCGEALGHLRADDAPQWLTIIVVGHLIVPSLLYVESTWHPEMWIEMAVWPTLTLLFTLILLPRCKGVILALLWATKAEGSEPD